MDAIRDVSMSWRSQGLVEQYHLTCHLRCEQAPVEDPSASREIILLARMSASGPHARSLPRGASVLAPSREIVAIIGVLIAKAPERVPVAAGAEVAGWRVNICAE